MIRKKINGITFNEVQFGGKLRYFKAYLNNNEMFVQFEYKNKIGFLKAIKKEQLK
tara:strand:+ start:1474 stop:1638 length:165 start_codon:yes stop_codon:yes gene_type:complete